MPSILYSATCVIRNDLYRLRIYVDELNSTDERLTSPSPFAPIDIPLNSIQPSLTRIDFQWIDEKKTQTNNIPPSITLHHLLNVQQTVSLPSKSKNKADRSSLEASSRSTTAPTTPTIEQSQDTAQISLTPNGTQQVLLKRLPFSFERFFSTQSKNSGEAILLSKTSIQIDYIDVSDSIRWTIKTLALEMDTEEVASQLFADLNLCLSTLKQRPRRLLAFVNPLSGKGKHEEEKQS